MKKITFSMVLLLISTVFTFATGAWQKLDLNKSGGGIINMNINRLELNEGKLYAATFDGIWISPSANGGDWEAYGLQGQNVTHLSFGDLKLASAQVVALNDGTKKANQLYKYVGTSWVLTNLNPGQLSTFGGVSSNFTQIKDADGKNIILFPTWGGGIWRSADGGTTWANYTQGTTSDGAVYKNVIGLFSFPGSKVIYGTDKVANSFNYMIWSNDYGVTWKNSLVGEFFNPHSIFVRKVNGKEYLYYGGENGNGGVVWCSMDAGASWQGSPTAGVPYWQVRKIIGDNDGKVYTLCSVDNVYVSQLNNATAGWDISQGLYNETFAPVGTGITFPSTKVSPASAKYYLSDIVKSSTKIYVSTIMTDGIYYFDLTSTGLNSTKVSSISIYPNPAQNEIIINADLGANISIYTITGKLVKSTTAINTKTSVDIKDLNASLYVVKVISAKGKLSTNRFVKN
jgi:hypothetical protein